ncbi:hypothetical protein FB451DRAFT_1285554 [Mycena latifolia]|nr:hypothetical protein FB451DRAFT_1285554 [Mycena latifolia]
MFMGCFSFGHLTVRDGCTSALEALKSAVTGSSTPYAEELNSVIACLSDLLNDTEISTSDKGVIQLAIQLNLLTVMISGDGLGQVQVETLIKTLREELQSIATDLTAARSDGTFNEFFENNSAASSLAKHNQNLTEIIARFKVGRQSTLSTFTQSVFVDEAPNVRASELSKLPQEVPPTVRQEEVQLGEITGDVGASGGSGRIGCQGGDGKGPEVNIPPCTNYKTGDICGGTGGTGGTGIEVGGKGGSGKAPVIRVLRENPAGRAEPVQQ